MTDILHGNRVDESCISNTILYNKLAYYYPDCEIDRIDQKPKKMLADLERYTDYTIETTTGKRLNGQCKSRWDETNQHLDICFEMQSKPQDSIDQREILGGYYDPWNKLWMTPKLGDADIVSFNINGAENDNYTFLRIILDQMFLHKEVWQLYPRLKKKPNVYGVYLWYCPPELFKAVYYEFIKDLTEMTAHNAFLEDPAAFKERFALLLKDAEQVQHVA